MFAMWLFAQSLSRVQVFVTPWTVAHQATLSMGFPRQEHWSGLPFPPLGDLRDPWIKPVSSALAGEFFTTEPPGKPLANVIANFYKIFLTCVAFYWIDLY